MNSTTLVRYEKAGMTRYAHLHGHWKKAAIHALAARYGWHIEGATYVTRRGEDLREPVSYVSVF